MTVNRNGLPDVLFPTEGEKSARKASFILGFENWNRDDFKALLKLVKSFVLLIWETDST